MNPHSNELPVGRAPQMTCFFSSRRRHTRYWRDWSSDVCSSDLPMADPEKIRDVAMWVRDTMDENHYNFHHYGTGAAMVGTHLDRKSVVQGQSVDLGGRRIIIHNKETGAYPAPGGLPEDSMRAK